jgi:DNA repair protein RadA/Sms
MARPQKRYICQACGSIAVRWAGQCEDCKAWNTLREDVAANVTPFAAKHSLQ